MTVFGVTQVRDIRNASVRKAKGASGSEFSRMVEGQEGAARSVAGAAMIGGIETLLAVQQPGNEQEEKRRSMEHGEDILRELDGLRLGLLFGELAPERLHSLARMVEDGRMKSRDPKLKAILDEIDIRVRVEMEKLLRPIT